MSVNVNRHNLRIWSTENPHSVVEHMGIPQKFTCFALCPMSPLNLTCLGVIFLNITGVVYPDILQLWSMSLLQEHEDDFVFQQDDAPPHFICDVRKYLNTHLPYRWTGRATEYDLYLLR